MLPERLDGLVIEITENELVSGDPAIHEALAGLRGRGARLAVDDTGAGYAGLTHVMRLQPDIIKLDRALTTGVDLDPAKAPLISSFVRYARDIDATVCAEGVETLAELERLADLDVAYGQGYGIARPSAPWVAGRRRRRRRPACTPSRPRWPTPSTPATPTTTAGSSCSRAGWRRSRRLRSWRPAWCPLAAELQADEVRLAGVDADARHAAAGRRPRGRPDAAAALRALGFGSCLTLPITRGGELVGHLEAYAREQRPWSRFQIGRARVHLLPARRHRARAARTALI